MIDLGAVKARCEAAPRAVEPHQTLENEVGPMVFAFPPKDPRGEEVRRIAKRAHVIEESQRDVPALVEECERLRQALRALDPQCITSPPCGSCVGCDARAALGETP